MGPGQAAAQASVSSIGAGRAAQIVGQPHPNIGREKIDNTDYDVLRLTMSDSFETYRYIDRKTHVIARGRDLRVCVETRSDLAATPMDRHFIALLEDAVRAAGDRVGRRIAARLSSCTDSWN